MTIGSILLGLALLGLVGLYLARPLIKPEPRSMSIMTTYEALIAQKEAILVQIRSLDFDHDTGKLTDADYERQREEFMVEAEDIFRKLDEIEEYGGLVEPVGVALTAGSTSDFESEIEAAVTRRRTQPATTAPEQKLAQPSASNGKSKYCPDCGRPTDPNDKFCANCGHKLLNPQHA
jgi:hypothetical protein